MKECAVHVIFLEVAMYSQNGNLILSVILPIEILSSCLAPSFKTKYLANEMHYCAFHGDDILNLTKELQLLVVT